MGTKSNPAAAWTTKDELKFITYVASDEKRNGYRPTIQERKDKLNVWLGRSYDRKWDKGVNVEKCREYAAHLYGALEQIQMEKANDQY